MKHYIDIERLKPGWIDICSAGDIIELQEKIDGANFSIKYDKDSDSIKAFSRRQELSFKNTLQGAWNYVQLLDKEKVKQALGDDLILFGEWLVKYSVEYPQDKYKQMYCFDLYDSKNEKWLSQDDAKKAAATIGLPYVPVFYQGTFVSWDHVRSFVGKTQMGGGYGEGVVVKNLTRLNDPNNRLPFYTKIVCEKFCETKAHRQSKPLDAGKMAEHERVNSLTATIVTEARVRKMIFKLIEDAIVPEDWGAKEMGVIAKNLPKRIYEDCLKEEMDIVQEIGEGFGKACGSMTMQIVRKILKERESFQDETVFCIF